MIYRAIHCTIYGDFICSSLHFGMQPRKRRCPVEQGRIIIRMSVHQGRREGRQCRGPIPKKNKDPYDWPLVICPSEARAPILCIRCTGLSPPLPYITQAVGKQRISPMFYRILHPCPDVLFCIIIAVTVIVSNFLSF